MNLMEIRVDYFSQAQNSLKRSTAVVLVMLIKKEIAVFVVSVLILGQVAGQSQSKKLKPAIEGEWWTITGQPDLGNVTGSKQQPVDFAVWQAGDGSWQLWSCIRGTRIGGKSRLFYRWEGKHLTDSSWTPKGIAMMADTTVGETAGGLQAPYVFKEKGVYYMFYGDWNRICIATSSDGKNFKRRLNKKGNPSLFSGPLYNTRDPMVVKVKDTYFCYYCAHNEEDTHKKEPQGAVFCRTSKDLKEWSEAKIVSRGGTALSQTQWYAGDIECPFVVHLGDKYILFRNQRYGKDYLNTQYVSDNPFDFGDGDDRNMVGQLPVAAPEIVWADGGYYIFSLRPGLDGIKAARLRFE